MSPLALRLLSQDRGFETGSQPGMFRQPERDKPSMDCVVNPSLLRPIRLRAASSFSGRTYNTTEHSTHQAQYLKLAKLAGPRGSGDRPRMLIAYSSVMHELPGHPHTRGAAARGPEPSSP